MFDYPSSPHNDFLETPEDRIEDENKEHSFVTSSIPVIQDVLDWLDSNADFFNTNDAVRITEKSSKDETWLQLHLAKRMRATFMQKADEFRTTFAEHLEKHED